MNHQIQGWSCGLLLILTPLLASARELNSMELAVAPVTPSAVLASSPPTGLLRQADCALPIIWQHSFSAAEQQQLQSWLCQSYQSVVQLLGPYLLMPEVHVYRRDSATEPVPWAFTDRGGDQRIRPQQVHFYVNPAYSLAQFLADWTAVHEFSHLALPLLDRSDQWFAEGFASYFQVQIQQQQGYVTDPGAYYRQKLQPQLPQLQQDQALIPLLQQLMSKRRYKAAYWGSTLWFIEAQTLLQAQGLSWSVLIQQYQQQHRLLDQDLSAVLASFDQLLAMTPAMRIDAGSQGAASAAPLLATMAAEIAVQPLLQQLWQQYQQRSAKVILRQHPLWRIPEKSEVDQ